VSTRPNGIVLESTSLRSKTRDMVVELGSWWLTTVVKLRRHENGGIRISQRGLFTY
jgi:hypothetical protein